MDTGIIDTSMRLLFSCIKLKVCFYGILKDLWDMFSNLIDTSMRLLLSYVKIKVWINRTLKGL